MDHDELVGWVKRLDDRVQRLERTATFTDEEGMVMTDEQKSSVMEEENTSPGKKK